MKRVFFISVSIFNKKNGISRKGFIIILKLPRDNWSSLSYPNVDWWMVLNKSINQDIKTIGNFNKLVKADENTSKSG